MVYTYDGGGNITAKTEYAYTTGTLGTATNTISYTYGNTNWKDLLTNYNGQAITYDAIGNPLSYRGYTMSWFGRQLKTLSGNGVTASYKYDVNGLRSEKTVNGVKTKYNYVNGMLLSEMRGDMSIKYTYDALGNPFQMQMMNTQGTKFNYYFTCNSRGDVEAIYNGVGTLIASYVYDSWGKIVSVKNASGTEITDPTHVANMNPFRYRGYYYDSETGLYYLQSRYYDPVVGRFVNADGYVSTGQGFIGYNMFVYCNNNTVNMVDPFGACPHDGKLYGSGNFRGMPKYNPDCNYCYAHGEYQLWGHDGKLYDLFSPSSKGKTDPAAKSKAPTTNDPKQKNKILVLHIK